MRGQEHRIDHATVGDALIYITRGIGIGMAIVAALAVLFGGFVWWDQASYRSKYRLERAALANVEAERATCIADAQKLARGLRVAKDMLPAKDWGALVERMDGAPSGAELKALASPERGPWEKYQKRWEPPPGDRIVD